VSETETNRIAIFIKTALKVSWRKEHLTSLREEEGEKRESEGRMSR
jgi:hypothetical protein